MTNYPFQGLDIATEDYEPWFWLAKAENAATFYRVAGLPVSRWARAGECKHQGETWRSPFGTPLAEIARTGGESTLARDGWSQAYDAWQPWESMEGYSVD